jgi:uncharacterized membrane protein (DUF2068 family)
VDNSFLVFLATHPQKGCCSGEKLSFGDVLAVSYESQSFADQRRWVERDERVRIPINSVDGQQYEASTWGERMKYLTSDQGSSSNLAVGIRVVAVFEAAKGILILLLGFGAFTLIHKNVDDIAERLVELLRVNPEGKLSNLFLDLANRATDTTLWVLAIGALVDAAVRLIEAFGLWREREWAQWFSLLSTALYLPGELYSLLRHPSWLKWGVLVTNALIVLFMLTLRLKAHWRQGQT